MSGDKESFPPFVRGTVREVIEHDDKIEVVIENEDGSEYSRFGHKSKPPVDLSGTNGNMFAILARCTSALKAFNQYESADEMTKRVFDSESYEEALAILSEYVDAR